ncbi:WXG100 family type VII secretion target [Rhodococcus sp. TAF43]|uniref:WXG100 family type VII secretion target n=1 Tax=unclassified Rhodococcus (in: high G+C Gram-positive bacteria) TaxID=192944 RepID=UPI000E2D1068|nr:WXG100 family type VII secretion target [Rhodococcus sp. AG1013]RDI26785.1 WXG100 family type VII secretion target [Rhodococcus sp. AG1013]
MRSDPERMHSTANRVATLADEFWDDVENLRREAENLMEDDWAGDAADTHAALWAEWVDSARRVSVALSGDAGLLHQAADAYTNADNRNAREADSLRLELDA